MPLRNLAVQRPANSATATQLMGSLPAGCPANRLAPDRSLHRCDTPSKIFENPELREKLRDLARLGDDMDRERAGHSHVQELEIIRIGLLTAAV